MKRALIVTGLMATVLGSAVLAYSAAPAPNAENDDMAACAAMMSREGMTPEGRRAMEEFMRSDKMPRAMSGMMEMARQMGNGDAMAGMDRMMEMMGSVSGMMGGQTGGHDGGMMGPAHPAPSQ